ncbi:MAG: holliday junction helicase RuvA [Patescibacteria group bacterium]|nr:holliday junction helicase RuvA [Patescibacteria group bacterium]
MLYTTFMIRYLKGKIIDKSEKFLVLETGGIGYKIFVTGETLESLKEASISELWIYHVIREDASDLFGFTLKEDLSFFELLIGISGIGPKTAIGILSVATTTTLKKAVVTGDVSHIVKVSGISKKVADKIVLELKGKIKDADEESIYGHKEEVDALEALKSLGYSHKDAREALKDMPSNLSTSERIKEALKILGK